MAKKQYKGYVLSDEPVTKEDIKRNLAFTEKLIACDEDFKRVIRELEKM